MNWITIIYLTVIVFSIIGLVHHACTRKSKQAEREMYDIERQEGDRGYSAQTSTSAGEHLQNLMMNYEQRKELLSKNTRHVCEVTIADLKENFIGSIAEEWREKADKPLYEFLSMFGSITEAKFTDVDKAYMLKDKCLSCYDKYWEITREFSNKETSALAHTDIWDRAKAHLHEEFLTNDFFSGDQGIGFWDSKKSASYSPRQQIAMKLTQCIESMRPEYERKMSIYNNILDFIHTNESVPRSELMRTSFDNAVQKEIESCYRILVKSHRILEMKIGGRFFVMLSDKEAAKRPPPKAKDENAETYAQRKPYKKRVPMAKTDYTEQDYQKLLQEHGIRCADMRSSGGCLWIEHQKNIKPFPQSTTVNGRKFIYASSVKCLGGQPGWYLSKSSPNNDEQKEERDL